jgi:hypothetical protein
LYTEEDLVESTSIRRVLVCICLGLFVYWGYQENINCTNHDFRQNIVEEEEEESGVVKMFVEVS